LHEKQKWCSLTRKLESHNIIEMHTYPLHRTATRGLYKQTNTAFQTSTR